MRELPVGVERARQALASVAEQWGAEWDPEAGTLMLPLAAGLRLGLASGRVVLEPHGTGSRLRLSIVERAYRVRWNAVVVLLLAAVGGILCGLWPFVPGLLPLVPFGAVLALVGWFLVVSRLVTNSPEEFLDAVAAHVEEPATG